MARYIDADKLSRAKFHPLPYTHIIPADIKDAEAYERGWNDAIDAIIESAPTADVVEVVRCKDCKWFNDFGCAIRIVDESDKPKEDDFCSFGERREDAK